jgi:hypothetical protein
MQGRVVFERRRPVIHVRGQVVADPVPPGRVAVAAVAEVRAVAEGNVLAGSWAWLSDGRVLIVALCKSEETTRRHSEDARGCCRIDEDLSARDVLG